MNAKLTNIFTRERMLLFLVAFGLILFFYAALFSNVFLRILFQEKIWVHRVDSIEKLNEVKTKFNGVEVNIVFIDSLAIFDVGHPPAPSIHLSLKEYLESCADSQLYFWLDFKNLEESNYQSALKRLNDICDQLKIDKDRFVVESSAVRLLEIYQVAGYSTSYYLRWPGLYLLNKEELKNYIEEVRKEIKEIKGIEGIEVLNISSNYHDYKILKEYFPERVKLLWLTGEEKEYSSSIKERFFLYEILMDKKVKVLLMEYHPKIGER